MAPRRAAKPGPPPADERSLARYVWPVVVGLLVVGALANLVVWSRPRPQTPTLDLPSYPAEVVLRGQEVYDATCASCHGADGAGYARDDLPAPALDGSMHAWHHPDSQLAGFIRNGVGQMPAVGAELEDSDIEAVLAYLKQGWEPEQLAYQTESSRQNP